MKKKKLNGSLYLFADRLPPSFGGMENHALHFIRFFSNHVDFPLKAIISKNDEGVNVFLSPDGTRLKTCYTIYSLVKAILKASQESKAIICFFNSGRWIEELIEIHDRLPTNAVFIQRTGGNDIIQANLSDLSSDLEYRQNIWSEIINNNINILISNSDYTTERLIKIGLHPNKISKISGGIDSETCVKASRQRMFLRKKLFTNSDHIKIVLFAARFVEFKGFPFVVDALKILKDDKIVLYCIGDGELKDEYINLGQQELGSRFRYCGKVNADSSLEYIAASDLLVSSSKLLLRQVANGKYVHTETMGRVLYEAIGCGTRVVATNVGGVSEIVKPEYGSLVEPEDSLSLSSAILYELAQKRIGFSEICSFHRVFSWKSVF